MQLTSSTVGEANREGMWRCGVCRGAGSGGGGGAIEAVTWPCCGMTSCVNCGVAVAHRWVVAARGIADCNSGSCIVGVKCPKCSDVININVDFSEPSSCVDKAVKEAMKRCIVVVPQCPEESTVCTEYPLCAGDCGKQATFFCSQCNDSPLQCNDSPLCEDCFSASHKFAFQRGHTKKSLNDFQFGKHRDHLRECLSLSDAHDRIIKQLVSAREVYTLFMNQVSSALDSLDNRTQSWQRLNDQVERDITSFFDTLMDEAQQKRKHLLTELQTQRDYVCKGAGLHSASTKFLQEYLQCAYNSSFSPSGAGFTAASASASASVPHVPVFLRSREKLEQLTGILNSMCTESVDLSAIGPSHFPQISWPGNPSLLESIRQMSLISSPIPPPPPPPPPPPQRTKRRLPTCPVVPKPIPELIQVPRTPEREVHSFTFTCCNGVQQVPPTLVDYKEPLQSNVRLARGIQQWTVPISSTWKITAVGASGGNSYSTTGGVGAVVSVVLQMDEGKVLNILVGQQGGSSQRTGGGGGGTFVWESGVVLSPNPEPWRSTYWNTNGKVLLCAGGGGGAGQHSNGMHASLSPNGTHGTSLLSGGGVHGHGGASGEGGDNTSNSIPRDTITPLGTCAELQVRYLWGEAGAGAGWLTNGMGGSASGISPLNGGHGGGGAPDCSGGTIATGGFGGGGGGSLADECCGGGGGGFSGGGPGARLVGGGGGGGGGGSFWRWSPNTRMHGSARGNGHVIISNEDV
ncbi:hypothetical protein Pelo_6054 [Pelomyxa schiedti]|nr:hypothetical protein Pelo_6054 [Pelomyxa schiedti]